MVEEILGQFERLRLRTVWRWKNIIR